MTKHAPLAVAIVLLVLPVLYLGNYFALVTPNTRLSSKGPEHYRLRGRMWSNVFWPLEQVDRKVRPDEWDEKVWRGFM